MAELSACGFDALALLVYALEPTALKPELRKELEQHVPTCSLCSTLVRRHTNEQNTPTLQIAKMAMQSQEGLGA